MGRRKLLGLLAVGAAAVAGALALVSFAQSTTGPNAQLANQDRAYGGGTYTPSNTRNFAIDAHAVGAAAYGNVEYATPATLREEEVTCLTVSGNKAILGGVITEATDPTFVGLLWLWVVQDNGSPISGTPDTAPFQDLAPAGDPSWPAGFPQVCPSLDVSINLVGNVFFPLIGGDIVVHSGGD
jgi:hypothetical protein